MKGRPVQTQATDHFEGEMEILEVRDTYLILFVVRRIRL